MLLTITLISNRKWDKQNWTNWFSFRNGQFCWIAEKSNREPADFAVRECRALRILFLFVCWVREKPDDRPPTHEARTRGTMKRNRLDALGVLWCIGKFSLVENCEEENFFVFDSSHSRTSYTVQCLRLRLTANILHTEQSHTYTCIDWNWQMKFGEYKIFWSAISVRVDRRFAECLAHAQKISHYFSAQFVVCFRTQYWKFKHTNGDRLGSSVLNTNDSSISIQSSWIFAAQINSEFNGNNYICIVHWTDSAFAIDKWHTMSMSIYPIQFCCCRKRHMHKIHFVRTDQNFHSPKSDKLQFSKNGSATGNCSFAWNDEFSIGYCLNERRFFSLFFSMYLRLLSRETIWQHNMDRESHRNVGHALYPAMLYVFPVRLKLVALLHFVLPNDVDAS